MVWRDGDVIDSVGGCNSQLNKGVGFVDGKLCMRLILMTASTVVLAPPFKMEGPIVMAVIC